MTAPSSRRRTRAAGWGSLLGLLALLTGMVVAPSAAHASGWKLRYHTMNARRVAPGVAYTQRSWTSPSRHRERSALLYVDLGNRHVHLDGYVPGNVLNSGYERTATQLASASRWGAVAATNASFFNMIDATKPPAGGIVVGRRILKTPHYGALDNLYVRSDNTAGIGPVTYVGGVRVENLVHGVTEKTLWSVNLPSDAAHGHLSAVTSSVLQSRIPHGCTMVTVDASLGGTGTVSRVAVATPPPGTSADPLLRVPAGRTVLVGCRSLGAWLLTLHPGQRVRTYGSLVEGTDRAAKAPSSRRQISMLVTGAQQIARGGRGIVDTSDHTIGGYNAESFACVSRNDRQVLLGTVDQYWTPNHTTNVPSYGVSMNELRSFALASGCYDAVALDGGGSTAMNYRVTGTRAVAYGNHAAYGNDRQRYLPNGVIVSYR